MNKLISTDQIAKFRDAQKDVLRQRLVEQEVCEYWGVLFSRDGVKSLTKQDITGFMSYSQNRRWREFAKDDIADDMDALKASLLRLFDESAPIGERINDLEPGRGELAIPYLGKAKISAMLLMSNPRSYGVWNDFSEKALKTMGVFPEFVAGERLGEQYAKVNSVLTDLATEYRLTLWRLDAILEQITKFIR